jgi:hypothetical protein
MVKEKTMSKPVETPVDAANTAAPHGHKAVPTVLVLPDTKYPITNPTAPRPQVDATADQHFSERN